MKNSLKKQTLIFLLWSDQLIQWKLCIGYNYNYLWKPIITKQLRHPVIYLHPIFNNILNTYVHPDYLLSHKKGENDDKYNDQIFNSILCSILYRMKGSVSIILIGIYIYKTAFFKSMDFYLNYSMKYLLSSSRSRSKFRSILQFIHGWIWLIFVISTTAL